MVTVDVVHAKERLSELLDRVEGGEEVLITRYGRAVAYMSPVARLKTPLPLEELAEFRATMPRLQRPSAELLREDRDEERCFTAEGRIATVPKTAGAARGILSHVVGDAGVTDDESLEACPEERSHLRRQ